MGFFHTRGLIPVFFRFYFYPGSSCILMYVCSTVFKYLRVHDDNTKEDNKQKGKKNKTKQEEDRLFST